MSVTYSSGLAANYANHFRQIVGASWYRSTFPHTRISRQKDTEIETVFTAGGYRFGTSTSGTITGRGADLLICDDPIKSQDVMSEVKREANNTLYAASLLNRLDNKQTGAIIVVMQRLHANDFVGALLESSNEWTVLNLPAIAEVDESIPLAGGGYYHRRAGEPLHPEREPLSLLHKLRDEMGPDAWAAQYQQAPVPPGGLIIRREWLRYHNLTEIKQNYRTRIIQSWDTAGKVGPRNSFSVCTTWLLNDGSYYLLDLVRGRFDFPTLVNVAVGCATKWKPSTVLIEDASTGVALAPELRKKASCPIKLVRVHLDKTSRLFLQQGKFASGRVLFPQTAPFLPELLKELLSFPQTKSSDQVDSVSQALAYEGSTYTLDHVS